MKRIFYSVAVLLFFSWVLTFFMFHAGAVVHILILLALICWLHAIITLPQKKYVVRNIKQGALQTADTAKKQRA